MEERFDVAVIGGGAAGLLAAGVAAHSGKRVVVLEKMEKCGRKVRITGKGRCNITNDKETGEILEKVRSGKEFVRYALECFSSADTVAFFRNNGVNVVVERGGRVFPASGKAWDVANALENHPEKGGASILCHAEVKRIEFREDKANKPYVTGVRATVRGTERYFRCSKVILATGGVSYPATGSTGDGYRLAYELGHTIEPVRPALVPLVLRSAAIAGLNGLMLKNVSLSLQVDGREVQHEFGEMEFTPFGISGAIVLKVSRKAVDALIEEHEVEVTVDLKPALDKAKIEGRIGREQEAVPSLTVEGLLRKMLPAKLIRIVAKGAGLPLSAGVSRIGAEGRERLIRQLKGLRFRVSDYRGFEEAIVTAGGVRLTEENKKTMESLLVKGLFFAGEVLDMDADTGGYNLQLAFSTGYISGMEEK